MSEQTIKRYTSEELRAMRAQGETKTDWERLENMTEEELEAAIAGDPDWRDIDPNWFENAKLVYLGPKKQLTLRVNADVVEWFRARGEGYQTRMNAALRAYMDAVRRSEREERS